MEKIPRLVFGIVNRFQISNSFEDTFDAGVVIP